MVRSDCNARIELAEHDRAPVAVGGCVFGFQARADGGNFRARPWDSRAGTESRVNAQVTASAILGGVAGGWEQIGIVNLDRHVEIFMDETVEAEIIRCYADHGEGRAAEMNDLADDLRVGCELRFPECVGQYDDGLARIGCLETFVRVFAITRSAWK